SEWLGRAGDIKKHRGKGAARRGDPQGSVFHWGRGARRDVTHDQGYTAINAAFMLDTLAQQERNDTPDDADRHAVAARSIRERIVAELPPFAQQPDNAWLKSMWWFYATLAEASFGLSRFSEARNWLSEG